MAAEVAEQPAALARLWDARASVAEIAVQVARFDPGCVVIAARGTSDHAALYLKYLAEITLGLPVGLASLSTFTAYDARPRLERTLWVAISQSGGSPDLIESTRIAGECGALTLAVTNTESSPLAEAAALHLDVLAGPETAVAATKTYTSELFALWLLVDAWRRGSAGDLPSHPDAARIPELAQAALEAMGVDEVASLLARTDTLVTTGRGYAYPTAREAALKLMETTYVAAQAFSAADLLHGPFAMLGAERPVVAVVPAGRAGASMLPLLEKLADQGATTALVTQAGVDAAAWVADRPRGPLAGITIPDCAPELAPILEILPLQRLAHTMALARGVDPDAPRGLNKVTETY